MRQSYLVALVVGAVSVWSLVGSEIAQAAPTSCATPPAAYTGTDATVAAVTQLNIDTDQNCQAVTDRLDTLDGDLKAGTTQAHTDSAAVVGVLDGWTAGSPLHVTLPSGGSGQAVDVTNFPATQPVQLSAGDRQMEADLGDQLDGDLWVLIGALVGCFLFIEALRKLWP